MGAKRKQRPKKSLTDKKQSERFRTTARELGTDETGEEFEQTFKKIVPATPSKRG